MEICWHWMDANWFNWMGKEQSKGFWSMMGHGAHWGIVPGMRQSMIWFWSVLAKLCNANFWEFIVQFPPKKEWPTALSVDPINGHIFLLDSSSTIFRLDLRLGIASLIVGTQKGCGPETSIQSIAFCPIRGILYMAMTDGKRIHTVWLGKWLNERMNLLKKLDYFHYNNLGEY